MQPLVKSTQNVLDTSGAWTKVMKSLMYVTSRTRDHAEFHLSLSFVFRHIPPNLNLPLPNRYLNLPLPNRYLNLVISPFAIPDSIEPLPNRYHNLQRNLTRRIFQIPLNLCPIAITISNVISPIVYSRCH
jgi:hypothetical protein